MLLLPGCFKKMPKEETAHPFYEKAQQLKREGRQQEALVAFLELTQLLPKAPQSHLEAGLLYLNHAQDPIEAIHHLRRFLEQSQKKAPQVQLVQELILKAKKDCVRQLSLSTGDEALSRNEFWNQLQQARKDNMQLQATVLHLRERLEALAPPAHSAPTRSPGMVHPPQKKLLIRTHTVQQGDTLSSISKQVYGTPQRWEDILKANPNLRSPQDLRIGQQLELP